MVTINKAVCILINALKNSKQQDHIILLLDHSEPRCNETLVTCNEWHFYNLTSLEPRYNEPLNNKVLSRTTHKLYSQLTQDYSLLNNHGCIVNKKIKIISVHRNSYTLFNQAKGNWDLFEWLYLHWLSQLGQQMICQSLHASWSKLPLHQGNPPSCHQLGKP